MSAPNNYQLGAAVDGDKIRQEFKSLGNDGQRAFARITQVISPANDNLLNLGKVQFAGAMDEQMKTLNGVVSNIEDNFSKMYREVGKKGLNQALNDALSQFNELVESGSNLAKTLGQSLASAVNLASMTFFVLADNADILLTILAKDYTDFVPMANKISSIQ